MWNPETSDNIDLITTIEEVSHDRDKNVVRGVIRYDAPQTVRDREGKLQVLIGTFNVDFLFLEGSTYFAPFIKKDKSDTIANIMGQLLFGNEIAILKVNINTPTIEEFLRRNPCIIKGCNWAGLDIPGTSKSSLIGSDVTLSPDYTRYDSHGRKRSIMVTLNDNSWTVRVSEQGLVMFYSGVSQEQIEEFLQLRIIPLLS